jgi:competence protein ComEA
MVLVWVQPIDQINQPTTQPLNQERRNTTMRKSLPLFLTAFLLFTIGAAAFAAEPAKASGVVNINTADAAQLSLLPRVGLKAAQRIVDYRKEHGSFQKTTDIMQVKGFGDKSYERLSAYIAVDGQTTLSSKVRSPRKPRSSKASKSRPNSAR